MLLVVGGALTTLAHVVYVMNKKNFTLSQAVSVDKHKLPLSLIFDLKKSNIKVEVNINDLENNIINVDISVAEIKDNTYYDELERIAKNLYICGYKKYHANEPTLWKDVAPHIKELYRITAEIALEAIMFSDEEL